jgi:hypothetical protein
MKRQTPQRAMNGAHAQRLEISEFIQELEEDADPRHAIARVRARISALERDGREVPAGLIDIARQLEDECAATSQGR